MQISYVRDQNNNFLVKLPGLGQNAVVLPGAMNRITGVDRRVLVGCADVSVEAAAELGFIVDDAVEEVAIAV